jgi:hypothetical protein
MKKPNTARRPLQTRGKLVNDLEHHLGIEQLSTLSWLELRIGMDAFTTVHPLEALARALNVNVAELERGLDLSFTTMTTTERATPSTVMVSMLTISKPLTSNIVLQK